MKLNDFIFNKITHNNLPLNINECINTVEQYKNIYEVNNEYKLFFYYIKNKVGDILNKFDHEISEIFGDLKIGGKSDITFFDFELEEHYVEWMQLRFDLYKELTNDEIRLLNYAELTIMNFISDIYSECKYELIDKNGKVTYFNKTKYGNDQTTQSFIKFLGTKFKEGYSFKPIKE